jgi:hypothetical protein
MSDAQQWADAHSEELHNALDELGASQMMHAFVNVRVPHRHSVVQELHKYHDYDRSVEEAAEKARRCGGGFFQKVWGGDVLDAFKHADGNNRRVIAKAYGKDHLLGLCSNQTDRNIVEERYPN